MIERTCTSTGLHLVEASGQRAYRVAKDRYGPLSVRRNEHVGPLPVTSDPDGGDFRGRYDTLGSTIYLADSRRCAYAEVLNAFRQERVMLARTAQSIGMGLNKYSPVRWWAFYPGRMGWVERGGGARTGTYGMGTPTNRANCAPAQTAISCRLGCHGWAAGRRRVAAPVGVRVSGDAVAQNAQQPDSDRAVRPVGEGAMDQGSRCTTPTR